MIILYSTRIFVTLLFFQFLTAATLQAQNIQKTKILPGRYEGTDAKQICKDAKEIIVNQERKNISLISVDPGKSIPVSNAAYWLKNEVLKVHTGEDLIQFKEQHDKFGHSHIRHRQFYKGVPVEYAEYTAHAKDGRIQSATGTWYDGIDLSITPSLSANQAYNIAAKRINAGIYNRDLPKDKSQLMILPMNETFKLVYKCNVYTDRPTISEWIYVDANNGSVIKEVDRIRSNGVPGVANTQYSGNSRPITVDEFEPGKYRLLDDTRSVIINTIHICDHGNGWPFSTFLINSGTTWSYSNIYDKVDLDAHFGVEAAYDLFAERYNWYAGDGNNLSGIINEVNNNVFSKNYQLYVNPNYAEFNPPTNTISYGTGDPGTNTTPLTSLEIVGHEYTHQITAFTAQLESGEGSALNESFSDIFGIVLRNDYGNNSWIIGDQVNLPDNIKRNLSNPMQYGQPDTYKGTNWDFNNEPHHNDGVMNYWFYLFAHGDQGDNHAVPASKIEHYCVQGIGMADAAFVAFMTLTQGYIGPNSGYKEMRDGSIQATEDYYGDNEITECKKAWRAVGLPPAKLVHPVYSGCPQIIDNSKYVAGGKLSDTTEHTYSVPTVGNGNYADCHVERTFYEPIKSIKVTILNGAPDDGGYVGNMAVTSLGSCSSGYTVTSNIDVTSQVIITGKTASFTLRALENCCCVTGWGSATASSRANAKFHWEVEFCGDQDLDGDGFTAEEGDGNDFNANINPGMPEINNGIDDDGDGYVDETGLSPFYRDADNDGYGSMINDTLSQTLPFGYTHDHSDCNDVNASIYPNAPETCNGIDDNCNGQIDEGIITSFYPDADGDGYGSTTGGIIACSPPAGYVASNNDCNDNNPAIHPGATEVCNGIDDDCNGATGDATWYADNDVDGYGNAAASQVACTQPAGYVSNNTDCDDSNPSINQGALPPKIWDKRFGGSVNQGPFQIDVGGIGAPIIKTPDGGYLVGNSVALDSSGDKSQHSQGSMDYWLVRMDADGNKIWDKRFGGSYDDMLTSILATADGGFLVGGYSYSGISGDRTENNRDLNYSGGSNTADYWVVKIDANGNKIWDKRFGGDWEDFLYSMCATSDGGFLLGGESSSGLNGDKSQTNWGGVDFWIVKIDINGNKVWDRRFGGTGSESCASIIATNDGAFLLGGTSNSPISGDKSQAAYNDWNGFPGNDYWIIKINPSGGKVWDKRFGGSYSDALLDIIQTTDGGYLLGGSSLSNASGDKSQNNQGPVVVTSNSFSATPDYWVIKVDASGSKIWDKRFGGNSFDGLSSVKEIGNGQFLLAGSSISPVSGDKTQANWSSGNTDIWLVKVASNGSKLFDQRIGADSADIAGKLIIEAGGSFVIAAVSNSNNNGDKSQDAYTGMLGRNTFDYWIIKMSATSAQTFYADADGDGYGNPATSITTCSPLPGYVLNNTDCNDGNANVHPGILDVCNGIDDDCDGQTDNGKGIKQWDKRFGGTSQEIGTIAVPTSDGGYILGGSSYSGLNGDKSEDSRGSDDYWIVKINAAGVKQWDKRFGGSDEDDLYSIQQTTDRGYILGGTSYSSASFDKSQSNWSSSTDFWIVKTDSNGTKQWDKRFGGTGSENLAALQQTIDGGYILAGYSTSGISGDKSQNSQGGFDYWIIKINSSGIKEWDKRFGGNADDKLYAIQQTFDGGFILGGNSKSGISGDKTENNRDGSNATTDFWVVRVDGSGDKQWDKRFGGSSNEFFASLRQTTDGGYILAGGSASGISGDKSQAIQGSSDYWMVKIDGVGLKQWDKRFGGFDSYYPFTGCPIYIESLGGGASCVRQTSDGGYLLGGVSSSYKSGDKSQGSQGFSDYWIVKTDNNGAKQWDARFGGDCTESFSNLEETPDGGFVLGGNSSSGSNGDKTETNQGFTDYWIVKIGDCGTYQTYYADADTDGFGNASVYIQALVQPSGYVLNNTDCNDNNTAINPAAFEVCNNIDDDCDQQTDENIIKYTYFADADADGFGDPNVFVKSCSQPSGYVTNNFDCNDANPLTNPSAISAKQFDARYGGTNTDKLYFTQQTSDGGYILGGRSKSSASGDKSQANWDASNATYDFWVVKTNSAGVKQWDKRYGGTADDGLIALQQTSDGNYILGGYSFSGISGDKTESSRGGEDYWVMKIDASGNILWQKTFGGSADDELQALQQTSDGGFIFGGFSYSGISGDKTQASQGGQDYWIVKTDANGNKQWDKRFGGNNTDGLYALGQTQDGGYILGGRSLSGISGDKSQANQDATNATYDYWIIKTDTAGNKVWDKRFGGTADDFFYSLKITSEGGFLLAGYSNSGLGGDKTQASRGSNDYWIVRTDPNGLKMFDVRFGGTGDDQMFTLQLTNDGGFICGGSSGSGIGGDKTQASQGNKDYWIVKANGAGVKQWDLRFGGLQQDVATGVQQTADGGYIIGGVSFSGISGDKTQDNRDATLATNDYWMVKLSSNTGQQTFYADADGDNYGNPLIDTLACSAPIGYVPDNTDCNDTNASIHPSAADLCNSIDDNCNGVTDENAITATITPTGAVNICSGTSTSLTANTGTGILYQWKKGNANISGATNSSYTTNKTGAYKVVETNIFACSSTSAATTVSVIISPAATITPQGNLDICATGSVVLHANSGSGYSYQWVKGTLNLNGATNQNYTATTKGTYKVVVTNSGGCSKTSAGVKVTKSCKESPEASTEVSNRLMIYPNPTDGKFTIYLPLSDQQMDEAGNSFVDKNVFIQIMNAVGEILYSEKISVEDDLTKEITLDRRWANGMYFIRIEANDKTFVSRLILQR